MAFLWSGGAGKKSLSRAIRSVTRKTEGTLRLAVAFWGKGAADDLIKPSKAKKIHIVCDLYSGACNPHELLKIVGDKRVSLRHLNGLHAKVYCGGDFAVIGSPNASINGLGIEGADDGNTEAGYLVTSKSTVSEIVNWFDSLDATELTAPMLKAFIPQWRIRQAIGRNAIAATKAVAMDLTEALTRNIHLPITIFYYNDTGYQAGASVEAFERFIAETGRSADDWDNYEESINNTHTYPEGEFVIDVMRTRKKVRIDRSIYEIPNPLISRQNGNGSLMVPVRMHETIEVPGVGLISLSDRDLAEIERIALLDEFFDDQQLIVPIRTFMGIDRNSFQTYVTSMEELPRPKSIFVKRVWGFDPWDSPVLSFRNLGSRAALMGVYKPGDRVLFIATKNENVEERQKGKILGMVEVDHLYEMDTLDLIGRRAENPDFWEGEGPDRRFKWPHGLRVTRAWECVSDPLPDYMEILGDPTQAATQNAYRLDDALYDTVLGLHWHRHPLRADAQP
ncbi:MAG: phospholipase D family protein [Ferrovibrio sp.]|uniref:phospholipase D family protein n=1 Tax=Ferrovibrio sp. TaxID=1917215 RepID=UPI00262A0FE8|nr:phospholipase D family protein [Ferrovibrio sp.]MCW0234261.1 phospholipase D family protein [Ferrovibrio sp.]